MQQIRSENKKVLLGLSGGVDSTAAALILREKGFAVTGLFFDVLGDQEAEREAAAQTAAELGIPFLCKNVSGQFQEQVISYFCDSYLRGETPNPCVVCNPTLKFRVLADTADEIGAAYIATGHYARVLQDAETGIKTETNSKTGTGTDGRYWICRAESRKDQSYMLYRLPQQVLRRLLLPLGEAADKETVRDFVRGHSIGNFDKKDSQEICFIKEGNYADYIKNRGGKSPAGDFVDMQGRVLGRHGGLLSYTVGQRKGLGITFGKPMFVIRLDAAKNQVVLGDDKDLFNRTVYLENTFLSCYDDGKGALPEEWEGLAVTAKIRYGAQLASARLESCGADRLRLLFDQPQRAAAAGQSAVFYSGDRLLGGGFITNRSI